MASAYSSKEGWLSKRGHFISSWKRRWFVLNGSTLSYYAGIDDKAPKGVISLVGASLAWEGAASDDEEESSGPKRGLLGRSSASGSSGRKPPNCVFTLIERPKAAQLSEWGRSGPSTTGASTDSGPTKSYIIEASSERDRAGWIEAIQTNITISSVDLLAPGAPTSGFGLAPDATGAAPSRAARVAAASRRALPIEDAVSTARSSATTEVPLGVPSTLPLPTTAGGASSDTGLPPCVRIWTGTWNMAEIPLPEGALGHLVPLGFDVYALGLQECMHADSLLGALRAHLGAEYTELHHRVGSTIKRLGFHGHVCVVVYVREWMVTSGMVRVSRAVRGAVALGKNLVITRAANKGAVAVALPIRLPDGTGALSVPSALVFVSCHLTSDASGKTKLKARNRNAVSMLQQLGLSLSAAAIARAQNQVRVAGPVPFETDSGLPGDGAPVLARRSSARSLGSIASASTAGDTPDGIQRGVSLDVDGLSALAGGLPSASNAVAGASGALDADGLGPDDAADANEPDDDDVDAEEGEGTGSCTGVVGTDAGAESDGSAAAELAAASFVRPAPLLARSSTIGEDEDGMMFDDDCDDDDDNESARGAAPSAEASPLLSSKGNGASSSSVESLAFQAGPGRPALGHAASSGPPGAAATSSASSLAPPRSMLSRMQTLRSDTVVGAARPAANVATATTTSGGAGTGDGKGGGSNPLGISPGRSYVFVMGDLNYRVQLTPEEALGAIASAAREDERQESSTAGGAVAGDSARGYACEAPWRGLLGREQLRAVLGAGAVFPGFVEPPITFPPSYRRKKGSVPLLVRSRGDLQSLDALRAGFSTIVRKDKDKEKDSGGGGAAAAAPGSAGSSAELDGGASWPSGGLNGSSRSLLGAGAPSQPGDAAATSSSAALGPAATARPGQLRTPSYTDRILVRSPLLTGVPVRIADFQRDRARRKSRLFHPTAPGRPSGAPDSVWLQASPSSSADADPASFVPFPSVVCVGYDEVEAVCGSDHVPIMAAFELPLWQGYCAPAAAEPPLSPSARQLPFSSLVVPGPLSAIAWGPGRSKRLGQPSPQSDQPALLNRKVSGRGLVGASAAVLIGGDSAASSGSAGLTGSAAATSAATGEAHAHAAALSSSAAGGGIQPAQLTSDSVSSRLAQKAKVAPAPPPNYKVGALLPSDSPRASGPHPVVRVQAVARALRDMRAQTEREPPRAEADIRATLGVPPMHKPWETVPGTGEEGSAFSGANVWGCEPSRRTWPALYSMPPPPPAQVLAAIASQTSGDGGPFVTVKVPPGAPPDLAQVPISVLPARMRNAIRREAATKAPDAGKLPAALPAATLPAPARVSTTASSVLPGSPTSPPSAAKMSQQQPRNSFSPTPVPGASSPTPAPSHFSSSRSLVSGSAQSLASSLRPPSGPVVPGIAVAPVPAPPSSSTISEANEASEPSSRIRSVMEQWQKRSSARFSATHLAIGGGSGSGSSASSVGMGPPGTGSVPAGTR